MQSQSRDPSETNQGEFAPAQGSQSKTGDHRQSICVIWSLAGTEPSGHLVKVLQDRDFEVSHTTYSHLVIASACRYTRANTRVVIVIDQVEAMTEHDSEQDRVFDSLERYAPGVIVWAHHPESNPSMVPFVRKKSTSDIKPSAKNAQKSMSRTSGNRSQAQSTLRLVHDAAQNHEETKGTERTKSGSSSGNTESSDTSIGEKSAKPSKPQNILPKRDTTQPLRASDVLDADELQALLASEMSGKDQPRNKSGKK